MVFVTRRALREWTEMCIPDIKDEQRESLYHFIAGRLAEQRNLIKKGLDNEQRTKRSS